MKIKELLEAPLNPQDEPNFLRDLENAGWYDRRETKKLLQKYVPTIKKAGSGTFSTVYHKEGGDSVVKITHQMAGDECAIQYLLWAKKRQNNPHVPKIYSLKYTEAGDLYARMEPLQKFNGNKYNWSEKDIPMLVYFDSFCDVPSRFFMKALGYKNFASIPKEKRAKRFYTFGLRGILNHDEANKIEIWARRQFRSNLLIQTLKAIQNLSVKGHCTLDVDISFGHNVMIRPSTNEIVITDPLA